MTKDRDGSGGRSKDVEDHPNRCGFAGTVWAEKSDDFAARDREHQLKGAEMAEKEVAARCQSAERNRRTLRFFWDPRE